MESSRIIFKNLPPSITEKKLRQHIGTNQKITDIKILPQKKIAFVGFKTPAEASSAASELNRTFIGQSRINAEIAKPIGDRSLRRGRRLQHISVHDTEPEHASIPEESAESKKRKRDQKEGSDKRKEYLDLLLKKPSRGISSTDAVLKPEEVEEEPEDFVAPVEEGESDDEYQSLPKRQKKQSEEKDDTKMEDVPIETKQGEPEAPEDDVATASVASVPTPTDEGFPPASAATATTTAKPAVSDDEWLRSHTNRLLDLVDPSDLPAVSTTTAKAPSSAEPQRQPPKKEDVVEVVEAQEEPTTNHEEKPKPVEEESDLAQIRRTHRLYVRNLSYVTTKQELQEFFSAYKPVKDVELPQNKKEPGTNKGYAMVQFENADDAVDVFHRTDGEYFQGRILHVLPGKEKVSAAALHPLALSKVSVKKQQQYRKAALEETQSFAFNALLLSQDAVDEAVAARLGKTKAELIDATSSDEAVRGAVRMAHILNETTTYFRSQGVNLEAFRDSTNRSHSCLLVKNLAVGTTIEDLRACFEKYGPVLRVLMPPQGLTALVQFANLKDGRKAFFERAFHRINGQKPVLETCPEDVLANAPPPGSALGTGAADAGGNEKAPLTAADLLDSSNAEDADEEAGAGAQAAKETFSLFVRNLNFTTTSPQLAAAFSSLEGFISANVKTKTDPKRGVLSMGYGFVDFSSRATADAAVAKMNGQSLQGHTLTVQSAKRNAPGDDAEGKKKKKKPSKTNKLVIKNVPFEVSRKELREFLSTYGELKALRMPRTFRTGNGAQSTRGFAFAEFATTREAEVAMTTVRSTHMLGRRLVMEYANADLDDAEAEVAQMQEKTRSVVNKVEADSVTRGRRQRDRVQIGQEEEE